MTSDKPKLKPCPFCGRVQKLSVEGWLGDYWVECGYRLDCNTIGPSADSAEKAVRRWNRRPKR